MSSRGSGGGGDASEAGEGLGVGELSAAVADLGEVGIPSKCGDFHYEEMSCQRYDVGMTRSSVRGLSGS